MSDVDEEHIREIFSFFSAADGGGGEGGVIERRDLDIAALALGFRRRSSGGASGFGASSEQLPSEHAEHSFRGSVRDLFRGVRGRAPSSSDAFRSRRGFTSSAELLRGLSTAEDGDGGAPVTLEEFSTLLRGEAKGRHPLDDVWAAYRLLSRLSRQPDSATSVLEREDAVDEDGDDAWAPVTVRGLRRGCALFGVRLGEQELLDMMDAGGPSCGGAGEGSADRASEGVSLRSFARVMLLSPWF